LVTDASVSLNLDALRTGGKPLTNVEITAAIVTAKGYGEEAMPALIRRVRVNLSYLLRNERVTKAGHPRDQGGAPDDGAVVSGTCGQMKSGDIAGRLQTTIQPSGFSFLCPLLGFLPVRNAVTSSRISSVLFRKFSLQYKLN
jgi:hypothetical protein